MQLTQVGRNWGGDRLHACFDLDFDWQGHFRLAVENRGDGQSGPADRHYGLPVAQFGKQGSVFSPD